MLQRRGPTRPGQAGNVPRSPARAPRPPLREEVLGLVPPFCRRRGGQRLRALAKDAASPVDSRGLGRLSLLSPTSTSASRARRAPRPAARSTHALSVVGVRLGGPSGRRRRGLCLRGSRPSGGPHENGIGAFPPRHPPPRQAGPRGKPAAASGAQTARRPRPSGRPQSCLVPGHPPCTSLRRSWYRAHRCAPTSEPRAGAGEGTERGAPGQGAPGPGGPQPGQEGEDEAARGPRGPPHGSQSRAAARSPAPAMPAPPARAQPSD